MIRLFRPMIRKTKKKLQNIGYRNWTKMANRKSVSVKEKEPNTCGKRFQFPRMTGTNTRRLNNGEHPGQNTATDISNRNR